MRVVLCYACFTLMMWSADRTVWWGFCLRSCQSWPTIAVEGMWTTSRQLAF